MRRSNSNGQEYSAFGLWRAALSLGAILVILWSLQARVLVRMGLRPPREPNSQVFTRRHSVLTPDDYPQLIGFTVSLLESIRQSNAGLDEGVVI